MVLVEEVLAEGRAAPDGLDDPGLDLLHLAWMHSRLDDRDLDLTKLHTAGPDDRAYS